MKFHRVLEAIWRLVIDANAYVDAQAPWNLSKEDPARMETVLYVLAEIIRVLGISVQPFMPESGAKILDYLGVLNGEREFSCISADFALKGGGFIEKPEGIFPRLEQKEEAA